MSRLALLPLVCSPLPPPRAKRVAGRGGVAAFGMSIFARSAPNSEQAAPLPNPLPAKGRGEGTQAACRHPIYSEFESKERSAGAAALAHIGGQDGRVSRRDAKEHDHGRAGIHQ